MKNLYLYFLIYFLSFSIYSQNKRVSISTAKIGAIDCKYAKSINLERKDTIYYTFIGFKDERYKTLDETASIMIADDKELQKLVSDLKLSLSEMDSKPDLNFTREQYKIYLFNFTELLYLYQTPSKGDGYTTLTKKEVDEFIVWLEKINFGKG